MRVALVSPYSYTYPGGVGRHVEALAEELIRQDQQVRLLTPYDPDDRLARVMHRGVSPERRPLPEHAISLGRTVGLPMNGAVSNLSFSTGALSVLGHELRTGGYDVVHVHEPNAPVVSWFALEASPVPTVGTFHTYSTSRLANGFAANVAGARRLYGKLSARIAVSEAAAWTARRFYGGRYRIVPNGVNLAAGRPDRSPGGDLEILFVGRAEGRKGLPVLLRAFEALRAAGVGARLTIAGVTAEEVDPLLLDPEGVSVVGRVTEEQKWELLGGADLLCAPSLGGESFGMVLTEAFASGTPVVASDIAGYRDVVRDGLDGLLVPAGDAVELGEALRGLAADPARRDRMGVAARERAERFSWSRVAAEVSEVYDRAVATTQPQTGFARASRRLWIASAEPGSRVGPERLPSLEPHDPSRGPRKAARVARRVVIGAGAAAGAGLTVLALERLGIESIGRALLAATPVWVLVGFMLMCLSMLVRAEAWHAILRAALPGLRVRRRDAARATMIGVLMSATLPARLGEPSRALIMSRRLGRMRDRFPVVLGTLVSQTLLNILALCVLGTVMFATVGVFSRGEDALVIATITPVVLLALVVSAPWILRRGKPSRFQRAQQAAGVARRAMLQVRSGLRVFRRPRLGAWATVMQLTAWAIQWMACYVLLVALGLDGQAGLGAAAAVLFAVNVTAALPATPSNLGVFQAACVAVLSAYGVGKTNAFAYGVILQAVEIATALAMGMPSLLREGMTWKDLRLRALHAAPVELRGVSRRRDPAEAEAST
ncbi:MAG TPA: lysylphosphatidylglycerol synthase domain-containing protein [Thermoleophilaceae bacterium]|nr:lysylphosphatidylglycerol synthase domain-containing protein [Thermoleophilaceae bacterium]